MHSLAHEIKVERKRFVGHLPLSQNIMQHSKHLLLGHKTKLRSLLVKERLQLLNERVVVELVKPNGSICVGWVLLIWRECWHMVQLIDEQMVL